MKTKEFREAIEKFAKDRGFTVTEDSEYIALWANSPGGMIVDVEIGVQYAIDTIGTGFESLEPDAREHLMNQIVFPYMKTPLEEREEEKKYIYKFPFNVIYETKKDLFVFRIIDGGLNLSNASVHDPKVNSRYHFTDKEVEKFTGKDRELFNVCEKIEVTE